MSDPARPAWRRRLHHRRRDPAIAARLGPGRGARRWRGGRSAERARADAQSDLRHRRRRSGAVRARAFNGAVANLVELETVALGNGAINSTPDLDQVIRRVPLVLALHDELYLSLAAEALRVAQGLRPT